ncbi:hypothetical protein [Devosia sp. Leaf64]|uniref:hypothetical protein n=1 Tax=Devosia sp. Leaf64 TaxID=1736229 RepID=UPI000713F1F3|nr:hypothetical protein [Devosia sp. Leaf64]KQN69957.1 hypothetical protein ASE94_12775 [Devosia sp. Leaf64]
MVAITNSYYTAYSTATSSGSASAATTATASAKTQTTTTATATSSSATSITLSDAAKAALSERSFAAVLADARTKLTELLEAAGRKSPLQNGELALDMSSLDSRELYAMASDKSFAADQNEAAKLEMQRRMEAALAGPLSIAKVTGNYTGLYNAAATFLDALGPEEKASADWQASRAAVTEGLKQLQTDSKTLPEAGGNDPVATYIKLLETRGALDQSMASLATNARTTIDKRYADATAAGKIPTFKPNGTGAFIDLSDLSSRTLSSIVLDKEGQFSSQEVAAAKSELRTKSSAVLMAGLKSASKSSDPTAFSQNVISAFSSLSAEERQAAGWSDKLYEAAVANYSSSNKLMEMFNQLGASSGSASKSTPGFSLAGLLG